MKNLFDLTGKVALVTGASSGLGVQFAKALAGQGANVAISARRVDKLEEVKKEVEALGVKCLAVQCDVSKTEDIVAMVEKTKKEFGRIDILVNNAGIAKILPAESQTDEEWLSTINVNLNAVYYAAREVGKVMIEQKYGRIINVGSICSLVGMANLPITAYNTSKGAVAMFSKSLANEWAKHNITVNCLGPGYFASEMTENLVGTPAFDEMLKSYCPMGRIGDAGELDGVLIFLASDSSSYTTGQMLCVDGGWTAI
ncbi:MAG: SDR family oxidoreductase [Defluviitaleaceae bacterium]|nr:SDR family oxidoreductase [Defluviitaleaceae bacterium]